MKLTNFQIILLGVFIVFIVAGVVIFSLGGSSGGAGAKVVIWGTFRAVDIRPVLDEVNALNEKSFTIQYVQKPAQTFDRDLVEALASQKGPDAFLLPSDSILKYQDKVFTIPFSSLSERDFKSTYAELGELYLNQTGALALPLFVDPLIAYWNRNLFSNASISVPPAIWEDVTGVAALMTHADTSFTITQSGVALGEYRNIKNAKEIMAALFLQAGQRITARNQGLITTTLTGAGANNPSVSALDFYTSFGNPAKRSYSWNRSLPSSQDYFTADSLGMYFGFGSEYARIKEKNPNLNFDVASLPQLRAAPLRLTFGRAYGLALLKSSPNVSAAYSALTALASADAASKLSGALGLAPLRRDLLSVRPSDPLKAVLYEGAIRARGFLDPDNIETDAIFGTMIEQVTSGRSTSADGVSSAGQEMEELLVKSAPAQ